MLVSDYNGFIKTSDQSTGKSERERRDIALYGVVSEIGSLVAAIKKILLSEAGIQNWSEPNEEIVEELGDSFWYCLLLVQIINGDKSLNVFSHDISNLRVEIGAMDERAESISRVLDKTKRQSFLEAAESFPSIAEMTFDDYQKIAFLTARMKGKTLLEVCLSVLWQLGAELLREKLPDIEKKLNKSVVDRDQTTILGEITWHLAAITSLYGLSLNEVIAENVRKLSFRQNRSIQTALHDEGRPENEQFPRLFEVSFVTIGKGRSRMYMNGVRLGDDLTDNAYDNDGYRFHDVMHLANAAKLGWSPVLRKLMGRKRKSDKNMDEVEDGARATIVEEAVVKAIHSEGVKIAGRKWRNGEPVQLFQTPQQITFKFLKFINSLVDGLEVFENRYWEWEAAILDGYKIFYALCREGQGTLTIDLNARSLVFSPDVSVQVRGMVSGMGSASQKLADASIERVLELADVDSHGGDADSLALPKLGVAKLAILDSLGLDERHLAALSVKLLKDGRVSVKATDAVQQAMWAKTVVAFQATFTKLEDVLMCTVLALSDPRD